MVSAARTAPSLSKRYKGLGENKNPGDIQINTGLARFILIDGITAVKAKAIHGVKYFSDSPLYSGMESLAQLGAFHIRFLTGFKRHAFLLKINRFLVSGKTPLDGNHLLYGTLSGRSTSAFSYILETKKENITQIEGEFLFALKEYDHKFKRELLREHYRQIFSSLLNAQGIHA